MLYHAERLKDVHPDLKKLFESFADDKFLHILILCGRRSEKEQNDAFARGASKLKFPKSKHNSNPSLAVDCAPTINGSIPLDKTGNWDVSAFFALAKTIKKRIKELGLNIEWGGDWKAFPDAPHWEIKQ